MVSYKNNYTGEIYRTRDTIPFDIVCQMLNGDLVGASPGESVSPVCPHCHKSYRNGGLADTFSIKLICRACHKCYDMTFAQVDSDYADYSD